MYQPISYSYRVSTSMWAVYNEPALQETFPVQGTSSAPVSRPSGTKVQREKYRSTAHRNLTVAATSRCRFSGLLFGKHGICKFHFSMRRAQIDKYINIYIAYILTWLGSVDCWVFFSRAFIVDQNWTDFAASSITDTRCCSIIPSYRLAPYHAFCSSIQIDPTRNTSCIHAGNHPTT